MGPHEASGKTEASGALDAATQERLRRRTENIMRRAEALDTFEDAVRRGRRQ